MKLVRVRPGMDWLFRKTLDAVGQFVDDLPGSTISFAWYAQALIQMYAQADPRLLLFGVLNDHEALVGHFLAVAEAHYGVPKLHIYQANAPPGPDSRAIVDEAFAAAIAFAKEQGCKSITMSTRRSPQAMRRRFGFQPKFVLMEREL